MCHAFAGLASCLLGYPDQALLRIDTTLHLAQELAHPYSLAFAHCAAAVVHQCRREAHETAVQAEAAMTLAHAQGFPLWAAMGTVLRGWALVFQGHGEAGIADIQKGLTTWSATGATNGVPVNQEDMLATIMAFSYLVIEGLRQLQAHLSSREEEDLYYLWCVFAELMGIEPDYIPEDVGDAAHFYQAYARRHFVAAVDNPAGVKLAAADLSMMQQMMPRTLWWLGLRGIPHLYMNDLLELEGCARVGIARVRGYSLLKWLLRLLPMLWMQSWKAWHTDDPAMHEALSQLIFQGMIRREYHSAVTFIIPDTLADLQKLA
jgi:hypothetical protein